MKDINAVLANDIGLPAENSRLTTEELNFLLEIWELTPEQMARFMHLAKDRFGALPGTGVRQ
jgi:hypothetical protein